MKKAHSTRALTFGIGLLPQATADPSRSEIGLGISKGETHGH
jgi:hypothetical protein